jgi:hypothetical protein
MVPPTFALVVNKETRIKMRGALENGEQISLPTRRESYDPLASEELDAVISRVDRAIRWNTFLVYFEAGSDALYVCEGARVILTVKGDNDLVNGSMGTVVLSVKPSRRLVIASLIHSLSNCR